MSRVKRGYKARRRRKTVLKAAKGFRNARGRLFKSAKESVMRARAYAYRDRKAKKRDFRRLWIVRINAAARQHGLSYSQFMGALKRNNIDLDRKILADMAVNDPTGFEKLLAMVR
ncbi:MAG: 50S ribosomal protein L20 [Proteobacteria bacterium]|nr:50S ribosomal protein L20 [Pseudomonadota bacterium]